MRAATIVGILLVVVGVVALIYQGITYTSEQTVFELGPLDVQAEERRRIPLPPILGALALIGGIVLIVVGSRK
jgi:drug/metabolite transporter (DMT)-like permease